LPYFTTQAIRLSNWTGPLATPTGGYLNQAGALYDPATPTLRYRLPGSTVTSVSGAGLVRDGIGLYHLNVTPVSDGVIYGAWLSNDGAYQPFTVDVQPAPI
jgi:hypothetical protein